MKRLVVLALLVVPNLSLAQAPAQPRPANQPATSSPLYWSVDIIINNYVRQISGYYQLTPQQEEFTKSLMSRRVKSFLVDHERDVRWMAAEIMDYQFKQQVPPPEIARIWGDRLKEMMPAIRAEIMDGNNQWRTILNDEQKTKHDRDLALMNKQFDNWMQMFNRWSRGELAPADLDMPGMVSRQTRTVRPSEDAWEYYVRVFTQTYSLDESQQQTAQSILREAKQQAAQYREAHKQELSALDAADQAAAQGAPKADPDELKRAQEETRQRLAKRREIEKPISEMFERLKNKLNDLPTSDQRRAHEARVSKLGAIARKGASQPAGLVTTRPATQQAASAEASSQ